jgi:NAD(P)-dependent dehydrogenase (short-subunit alcohol dehydrogenase family)
MNESFRDKVVAITGAARGIGETLVREFLRQGARVVAMDRSWDGTSSLHTDLLRSGSLALSCDITSDAEVDAAYGLVIDRFDGVDVLINNAAMRQRDFYPETGASAVLDTEDCHWERMYQVNVVGSLKVIRRFVRPMIKQGHGSVINVSANGSLTHQVGTGVHRGNHPGLLNQPYDATKAAFTSLSFYLAEELKPSNVAVNIIFPGPTRTTGSEQMSEGRARLGLRMGLLESDHVVPVCLYLARQTGSDLSGQAFDVVPWNAANAERLAATRDNEAPLSAA